MSIHRRMGRRSSTALPTACGVRCTAISAWKTCFTRLSPVDRRVNASAGWYKNPTSAHTSSPGDKPEPSAQIGKLIGPPCQPGFVWSGFTLTGNVWSDARVMTGAWPGHPRFAVVDAPKSWVTGPSPVMTQDEDGNAGRVSSHDETALATQTILIAVHGRFKNPA